MLAGLGTGNLCRLRVQNHYGRELPVATVLASGEVALVKWLKKTIETENAQPSFADSFSAARLRRTKATAGRRRTSNAQRSMKDLPARPGTVTHEQFETEIRPQLVELVRP